MTSNTLGLSLFPSKRTAEKLQKVVSALVLVTMVVAGSVLPYGGVNKAEAALSQAGPIVVAGIGKSLPAWFMDSNGLAVEVMEAADPFGISVPPIVGDAFSQELGFSDEGFYWTADALPANPAGPVGITVLALEVAYLGGTVEGGESIFGRIRHRYDVAVPGTYTVTHPFGVNTYVVDVVDPGAPEINDSSDIGCAGLPGVALCNTALTLASGVGPFLTWDTFNLNPALTDPALINAARPGARYLGNPNIPHAITGSPFGTNFIRVQGPAGAFGATNFIQDNLFTVTGRVAVVDIVPPVITAASVAVPAGSANAVVSINVTDNLGIKPVVGGVKIDLGSLGNALNASLTGAQSVPPSTSPATGTGTFTINTAANTLSFNVNATGLVGGPVSSLHIHGPAVAGVNAPMLFDMGTALPAVGVWNYPEIVEADILAGRTYVNVHTPLFTDLGDRAEIRGQILPVANIQNMVLASGTVTNGTWGVILPTLNRLGAFSLPITATDGSNTSTANLSLSVNELTSVTVTPTTAQIIGTASTTLVAAPLDNNLAPIAATVTWSSSNAATAAVDANGVVTGVNPGTAVITATAVSGLKTVTGTSTITVLSALPVFASVTVTPAVNTIIFNAPTTKQLSAIAKDQFGNALAVQPVFAWSSSNPAAATVNATSGLVTMGTATGTATITATATVAPNTFSGTATVNVVTEPQVLTSVTLTPAPASVVRGLTTQLTAAGVDQFGGPMVAAFTFSSGNPAAATVNAAGLVTGVATGTATITATSGAMSATSAVTVTAAPQVLTSIAVTPSPAVVLINGTKQLAALGKDQFGDPMVPQPVLAWTSSNPALVAVNASGLLTAGAATGTATITASSGLVSGTTTANVVTDFTAPVITITGANPTVFTVGQAFTDLGATAIDETDGAVVATTTSNNVNANEVGTYAVVYSATDAAGNKATATRTVTVQGIVVNGGGAAGGGGGGGGGGGFGFGFSNFLANIPGLITTSAGNQTQVTITNPQGQVLGVATVKFNRNRGRGERGDDIRELQIRLQQEGVFDGPFTGFFGPMTQDSLRRLQIKLKINESGVLDIETRAKLNGDNSGQGQSGQGSSNKFRFNTSLRLGARGVDVMELQKMLQAKGFFSGTPTQFFGPITQKALVEFQRDNGINPTGFFGPTTRAKVNIEVEQ